MKLHLIAFIFGAGLLMLTGMRATAAAAAIGPFRNVERVERDIPYVTGGLPEQTGNLYIPRSLGNHPALLLIHGGGWKLGTRRDPGVVYIAQRLAAHGYEVFSINYRLTGNGGEFPNDLIDCKNALAWMRMHAGRLHIKPRDIFVAGCSAGGYLALMTAYTAAGKEFLSKAYPDVHLHVKAVIAFYAPTNLMLAGGQQPENVAYKLVHAYVKNWLDLHPINGLLSASPIGYVAHAVPTLLFQGTQDRLVPPIEASIMAGALLNVHKPVKLVMVKGGGHAFMDFPSPRRRKSLKQMLSYMQSRMKH